MRIFGVDFSSAQPGSGKKIYVAECTLSEEYLRLDRFHIDSSGRYDVLNSIVKSQTEAAFGFDFPFGQAARFLDDMGWDLDWDKYSRNCFNIELPKFREAVQNSKDSRPEGEKERRRLVEERAKNKGIKQISEASKLVNPPLAMMFFRGVPCLEPFDAVLPVSYRKKDPKLLAFEAYPRAVVKNVGIQGSYTGGKGDIQRTERRRNRAEIMNRIQNQDCMIKYGFVCDLRNVDCNEMIDEAHADCLDSVLCAIQAGWAYQKELHIIWPQLPEEGEIEGWIADPALVDVPRKQKAQTIHPTDPSITSGNCEVPGSDALYISQDNYACEEHEFASNIFTEIRTAALCGSFVTYSEISRNTEIGLNNGLLFKELSRVLKICKNIGLPAITSIVVSNNEISDPSVSLMTGSARNGFLRSAGEAGFDVPSDASGRSNFVATEQKATFEFFRKHPSKIWF